MDIEVADFFGDCFYWQSAMHDGHVWYLWTPGGMVGPLPNCHQCQILANDYLGGRGLPSSLVVPMHWTLADALVRASDARTVSELLDALKRSFLAADEAACAPEQGAMTRIQEIVSQ